MDISFIGAGRLATNLAPALHNNGHRITHICSRTMESAQALAEKVNAEALCDIAALPTDTDAIIVAVKDDALPSIAAQMSKKHTQCPLFHTAGSVPCNIFHNMPLHGVIYPMQTFSKERIIDFSLVPFFVEANCEAAMDVAKQIATSVSNSVAELDSEKRRHLHLAAVMACNFANHCYTLAADILESQGLDFSIMLPLIDETAAKVHTMHPRLAQTGPAVRYDKAVIERQREMLAQNPLTQQIYDIMSKSIHEH